MRTPTTRHMSLRTIAMKKLTQGLMYIDINQSLKYLESNTGRFLTDLAQMLFLRSKMKSAPTVAEWDKRTSDNSTETKDEEETTQENFAIKELLNLNWQKKVIINQGKTNQPPFYKALCHLAVSILINYASAMTDAGSKEQWTSTHLMECWTYIDSFQTTVPSISPLFETLQGNIKPALVDAILACNGINTTQIQLYIQRMQVINSWKSIEVKCNFMNLRCNLDCPEDFQRFITSLEAPPERTMLNLYHRIIQRYEPSGPSLSALITAPEQTQKATEQEHKSRDMNLMKTTY